MTCALYSRSNDDFVWGTDWNTCHYSMKRPGVALKSLNLINLVQQDQVWMCVRFAVNNVFLVCSTGLFMVNMWPWSTELFFFAPSESRFSNSLKSAKYCLNKPYINRKIYSAFRWCINLNWKKMTLMTGFVVQTHIWYMLWYDLYSKSNANFVSRTDRNIVALKSHLSIFKCTNFEYTEDVQ